MYLFIFVVGVGLTAYVAFVIVRLQRESKRKQELQELAAQPGYQLSGQLSDEDMQVFKQFPVSSLGDMRAISNVLTVDSGEFRIVLFDMMVTTITLRPVWWAELTATESQRRKYRRRGLPERKRKKRKNRPFTIALAIDTHLHLPEISCEPESWKVLFNRELREADIDLEEDAEFSRRFLVRSPERDRAQSLLTVSFREIMKTEKMRSFHARDNAYVMVRPSQKLNAERVEHLLKEILLLRSEFMESFCGTTSEEAARNIDLDRHETDEELEIE